MALQDRTRFEPAEVEPRIVARWLASGLLPPRAGGRPGGELLDRDPAAERHRRAAHGPRAQRLDPGRARALRTACAGERTKWILGTDHAGIATQTQVERLLAAEGTSREELGREAFVERMWAWREQYGGTIIEQFKRLGASLRLRRRALHARRALRPRPCSRSSSTSTTRA